MKCPICGNEVLLTFNPDTATFKINEDGNILLDHTMTIGDGHVDFICSEDESHIILNDENEEELQELEAKFYSEQTFTQIYE